MPLWSAAAAGDQHVVAGDVLNWITTKENAIKGMVPLTLWVLTAFFAMVAWMVSRSWKKAVVAFIGGAIIIAIVGQLTSISDKVKTEVNGAPAVIVVPAPRPPAPPRTSPRISPTTRSTTKPTTRPTTRPSEPPAQSPRTVLVLVVGRPA